MIEDLCEHGNDLKSCEQCMKTFRAVFDYLVHSPPLPIERMEQIFREMAEKARA